MDIRTTTPITSVHIIKVLRRHAIIVRNRFFKTLSINSQLTFARWSLWSSGLFKSQIHCHYCCWSIFSPPQDCENFLPCKIMLRPSTAKTSAKTFTNVHLTRREHAQRPVALSATTVEVSLYQNCNYFYF